MRIYISGPMTGYPNSNRESFDKQAEYWRSLGHFVINPHDITSVFGSVHEIAMAFAYTYGMLTSYNDDEKKAMTRLARSVMDADIAALRTCDRIVLLRGWQISRGAKAELAEAIRCGLEVEEEV